MRALLCTIALLRAGTHARMATPCRAGTDHCRLVNTQKSIRAAADRAHKSAAEAIAWTLGTALGLKYVAARA